MSNGYVYIYRGGKFASVPRRLVFRRYGVQPYEVVCRHSCDNRWCINPDHIAIGTRGDNARDAKGRGRNARREIHGAAKLTEADIQEIRDSPLSGNQLAKVYSVAESHISNIRHGKRWA